MGNIPEGWCILLPELLTRIDEEFVHPSKGAKVEEHQSLKDVVNRFMTDVGTFATFSQGFVSDSTKAQTFHAWNTWRNGVYTDDLVPGDILTSCNAEALNKWLLLLVIEARMVPGILEGVSICYSLDCSATCQSSPNFLSRG